MAYSTKCCNFISASNQYIDYGNIYDYERTDSFSWSFWMKSAWTTTKQYLISKQQGGTPNGWAIFTSSAWVQDIQFELTNTTTTNSLVVAGDMHYIYARDGGWHHVVVTYAGTSVSAGVKIYYDSVSVTISGITSTLSATIKNSATMRIGAVQTGFPTGCYSGLVDDVAAYNRVLTQIEVRDIYNLKGPGDLSTLSTWGACTGWWKMGDGDTYPTILDNTASGHNGTMTNMTAGNLISPSASVQNASQNPKNSLVSRPRDASPSAVGSGVVRTYQKRARDLGQPSYFTEWVTNDRFDLPPTAAPVGPWGDIVILAEW